MNKNIKIIKKSILNLDIKILKIMKKGLKYSLYFCILASLILITYNISYIPILFYTGISLLKSGLLFATFFIICGFVFDKILNDLKN